MPRVSHERWVSIGFLLPFRGMLGSSARTNPPALRVQDGARVAAVQGSEKAWLERSWCRACRGQRSGKEPGMWQRRTPPSGVLPQEGFQGFTLSP